LAVPTGKGERPHRTSGVMQQVQCPQCKTIMPGSSNFCTSCGTQFAPPAMGMAVPMGQPGMVTGCATTTTTTTTNMGQPPMAFAQPVMAQPMMAQPVVAQPVGLAPVGMQTQMYEGRALPFGADPGGSWVTETFIGPATLVAFIILLFVFWPACAAPFCCPCDQREVYISPDGLRRNPNGVIVPPGGGCNC